MNCDWQNDVRLECFTRAELAPPAIFGEAEWDCLLALHSNDRRHFALDQLAGLMSVAGPSLHRCLARLEDRQLVTGKVDADGDIRAVLTSKGRELLEIYLSASINFQVWNGEQPRLPRRSGSGRAIK